VRRRARLREPARIEPPQWYRTFHAAAWDEPDAQEQRMLAGCEDLYGAEWVAGRHRIHAHRRWCEAKHAYRRAHPALATQEFEDIIGAERRYREQERRFGA
jgi:hypothetical protein